MAAAMDIDEELPGSSADKGGKKRFEVKKVGRFWSAMIGSRLKINLQPNSGHGSVKNKISDEHDSLFVQMRSAFLDCISTGLDLFWTMRNTSENQKEKM